MAGKIESITATVPCTGIQYCDLRPTISASSIDEYREQLAEVGRLAGNDAFVHRISQNKAGKEKIIVGDDVLYFDREAHEYEDEQGNKYWTGSTWAAQFEKPFDPQLIAPKVAEKKLCTVDEVIAGWNMKSEVSLSYGTTVHKALECGIKYNELPNNPHLSTLVQDYLDMTHEDEQVSEQFVVDSAHKMCGTIDVLVNNGNKHVTIRDFKGLALDTLIPTPSGFTTMGEIEVGDKLYDGKGNLTQVEAKSEVHHKECYKLEFSSGDPVVADYDHRWLTIDLDGKEKIMTTEEIANSSCAVRIPLTPGINEAPVDLPIDPYLLGVWLGDGKHTSGELCLSDPNIWDEILERGYSLGPVQKNSRGENCEVRSVYGLVGKLKELGVYGNKHIPDIYLRASEQQRKDLLAGLLDTDGSYSKLRNEVTVCTTKEWLVDGLKELVGSLGGKTTVCDYKTSGFGQEWEAKQIRVMTLFNPFKVKNVPFELTKTAAKKRTFKYVTSCMQVESVPTQCIKVTSPEHTYLFGKDFHVTHNTGDIYKKISLAPRAKELWPELENKTISIYQLQLSFYAFILRQQGYTVSGLEIWAEKAEAWEVVKLPVLDIRKALEAE